MVNMFRHSAAPKPWVVGRSLNDSLEEVKIKCDAEEASTVPPIQGWRSVSCLYFCVILFPVCRSLYNKYFMLDR